jgi:hypothetical protein
MTACSGPGNEREVDQMNNRKNMIAGLVFAQSLAFAAQAWAQAGNRAAPPKEPVDPGAITVPPKSDPAAVKRPPGGIDPEIARQPRAGADKSVDKPPQNSSKRRNSKDSSCQGPAELCKQSSPR